MALYLGTEPNCWAAYCFVNIDPKNFDMKMFPVKSSKHEPNKCFGVCLQPVASTQKKPNQKKLIRLEYQIIWSLTVTVYVKLATEQSQHTLVFLWIKKEVRHELKIGAWSQASRNWCNFKMNWTWSSFSGVFKHSKKLVLVTHSWKWWLAVVTSCQQGVKIPRFSSSTLLPGLCLLHLCDTIKPSLIVLMKLQ